MTKIQRSKLPTVSQLLNHILENPRLVDGVRELPGPALNRLIRSVGLEDAAELVALATTEQLEQVFDEDLWRAGDAGQLEHFDPARFALWLHAFSESGEDAVVKRLTELPIDFVTLAVQRLILVIDIEALAVEMSSSRRDLDQLEKSLDCCLYEEWEEFRLISRDDTVWDEICQALFALDRNHHALLRQILEHCSAMSSEWIEENGGLYDVLTSDEMLEHDVRGERDDRRAGRGYVSAADAKAFLALCHHNGEDPRVRDPITKAYFRELTRVPATPTSSYQQAPRSARGAALMHLLTRAHVLDASDHAHPGPGTLELPSQPRPSPSRPSPSRPSPSRPSPSRPSPSRPSQPLTANSFTLTVGENGVHGSRLLDRALMELRETDSSLYQQRMDELGFLANVLVSAPKRDRQQLRPIEALEAALDIVNVAFEQMVVQGAPRLPTDSMSVDQRILRSTTLDGLFRSAYPSLFTDANALPPALDRLRRVLANRVAPSLT